MRLVVGSLLVAGAAHAGPAITPSRLDVVGDACPATLVRDRVRAFVGTDPFVDDARVVVRTELVAEDGGVRARLEVRDGGAVRGTRELAAPRCETLTDELALAIAMVLREVEPEVPPARDAVGETRDVAASYAEPARSSFALLGGAQLAGSVVGGLFGVRVHVAPSVSVGVELALGADETVAVPLGQGRAHISRGGGTLAGCWHVASFAGCATTTAGWVRGSGDGLAMTRNATTPLFAVGARVAFEWPVTRWLGVRVHADLRALLTRTRFTVDDDTVWTSSAVETALGLAAVLPIP